LQSAKDAFPGFDQWYEPWQLFMAQYPRLAWVRDARTQVVKRSGLASRSRARVTLLWSYLEPARLVYDLPPELSVEELVGKVAAQMPEPFAPNSVLRIERRWEVDELPGEELLEVLADCLRVVMAVADQAHGLLHGSAELPTPEEAAAAATLPDCLEWPPAARTLMLNPRTGAEYVPRAEPAPTITEKQGRRNARRYGWRVEEFEIFRSDDPLVVGEGIVPLASGMLKADGYHIPMLWLHRPGGGWDHLAFAPEDRGDKYLFWHLVANRVAAEGHDGFVFVAESWLALAKDDTESLYPDVASDPGRLEALTVTAESKGGRKRTWIVPFRKRFGRMVLEEPVDVEEAAFFAEPIRRVWAGQSPTSPPSDRPAAS
jgi:hypothetical protein